MNDVSADAHTHVFPSPGEYACVSACFPGDWQRLSEFRSFYVKKSYGIHPKAFDSLENAGESEIGNAIAELDLRLSDADAVGETGLDRKAGLSPSLQEMLFKGQLDLASKRKLPVVVHCSGCPGKTYEILRRWSLGGTGTRFLLHAAKFSKELTLDFQLLGAYFSFGLRELSLESGTACAAVVSGDRLMVESDSFSGGGLAGALDILAEIRSVRTEDMARTTFENFLRFYFAEIHGNIGN